MMTHDEMIAVIQHHKNGGKVQYRRKYEAGAWTDINPCWDFSCSDYRAKPEPLVLWVGVLPDGQTINYGRRKPEMLPSDVTLKKFVEVTE